MAPSVWVGLVDWSCHLWRSFAEERCSLGRRGRRYEPGPGSSEYAAAMAVPSDSAGPEGLLGRSAEFDRLRALRRTGASSLVLVSGEAGVGKSALVNAFAAERRRAGTRVLWGGAGPASERLGVLRQPARALGIALPDVDASVGPSEQEWELTDVLAAVLLDLRSGLVVLEDLHWADGSSLAVITALSARLVGSGVMLLGTTRPQSSLTADGSDRLWRGADVLRLGSLDDVAVAALCERWSGEAPSSTEVAVLRRRTGGNPLLVREVVVAGGDVSRSVVGMDVLVSSVERFGLEIADMLGVLAVAGSLRGLALVAGLSGVTVDEFEPWIRCCSIRRGARRRLIRWVLVPSRPAGRSGSTTVGTRTVSRSTPGDCRATDRRCRPVWQGPRRTPRRRCAARRAGVGGGECP